MASNRPVSDTDLRAAVNALVTAGGNTLEAARQLGLAPSTFKDRIREATKRGTKPTVADSNNPKVMAGRIKALEAELKQRERESDQAALIRGVIGAMVCNVEALDPPPWLIKPSSKPSAPGVPTLFMSDFHWGERVYASQINGVNEYNLRIAHERLRALVDAAVHLLEIISPKMDYPGIVVPLGGDMISGNIHDELTATNELNTMPTVLDIHSALAGVIEALADKFGAVFLPCVSGNHGRDTHKIWAKDRHHTSFDWLIYQFLARRFENDKRVTFFIPEGIAAHYKIYDYRYRLAHGDRLGRGGDGIIGMLGPVIRGDHRTRSRDAQIDLGYDTQIIGHFHQYTHTTRVIVNGSLKGYDEYASTEGFPFEPPQQALWLTHPKYNITFRMPVYVDKHRDPKKTSWVSVASTT